MLNESEKKFKTQITRLKDVLSVLPKHEREALKEDLRVRFGLDLAEMLKLEERLDEKAKKVAESESKVENPFLDIFNDFFKGEVDVSFETQMDEIGKNPFLMEDYNFDIGDDEEGEVEEEFDPSLEILKQLSEGLDELANSAEFDRLLQTIAKITKKTFNSYRSAGFSEEQSLALVLKDNVGLDTLASGSGIS